MSDRLEEAVDELLARTTELELARQEAATLELHLANAKDREEKAQRTLDSSVAELFTQRHILRSLVEAASKSLAIASAPPAIDHMSNAHRLRDIKNLLDKALALDD